MRVIQVIKKSKQHFLNRSLIIPWLGETQAMAEKHEKFVKAVEIWDDTLNITYGKFRDIIAEICRSFNNQFDITVEYIDALEAINGDGWVVIHDEDDLLHPRLPKILRSMEAPHLVRWDTWRCGPGSLKVGKWDEASCRSQCCLSGSYAFQMSHLKRYHELLRYHGKTWKYQNEMGVIDSSPLGLKCNQPTGWGILGSHEGDIGAKIKASILRFVNPRIDIPQPYRVHFKRIIEAYMELR